MVWDLLLRTDYPSRGYMVTRGATSIWERWNGDTAVSLASLPTCAPLRSESTCLTAIQSGREAR
ncbi:alpha-L-rhamnosidase-related protein [Sphingomonas panni]|uniref:alpha-L-rhamnosidase-related protein n=1 Tax=uncultured Sphingomonas sp. TaxID=158754 RepID=UPI00339026DF